MIGLDHTLVMSVAKFSLVSPEDSVWLTVTREAGQ